MTDYAAHGLAAGVEAGCTCGACAGARRDDHTCRGTPGCECWACVRAADFTEFFRALDKTATTASSSTSIQEPVQ